MSASILSFQTAQGRRSGIGNLRLRLKPAHRSCGFVQGSWWPRSTQLISKLPLLFRSPIAAGGVRRPGYFRRDQLGANIMRMEFSGRSITWRDPAPNPPTSCR
jgi:hypothetical protein